MMSLKKDIILRYIYLTLKPKINKNLKYQYEDYFIMLILIYFNLFRKGFLTKIPVTQIDSL